MSQSWDAGGVIARASSALCGHAYADVLIRAGGESKGRASLKAEMADPPILVYPPFPIQGVAISITSPPTQLMRKVG
jgi:hypothetical protein